MLRIIDRNFSHGTRYEERGAGPELGPEIERPSSCLPADALEGSFAQQVGIALAVAGKFDELAGDGSFDVLVAVSDPQGEANKFEGDTEDAPHLGIQVLIGKEWGDRHFALPSDRRERDGLSATDACGAVSWSVMTHAVRKKRAAQSANG
jgi:hypothetical protein